MFDQESTYLMSTI